MAFVENIKGAKNHYFLNVFLHKITDLVFLKFSIDRQYKYYVLCVLCDFDFINGNIDNKFQKIKQYQPDVICLGYDQIFFVDKLKSKLKEFKLNTKIIRLRAYQPEQYKSSKILHSSVSAIIKRGNKILMIDRAYFPLGWACVAGHVDENETPQKTLKREIKEEINLEMKNCRLLIHEYVSWNKCVKGVTGHDWYIYQVEEWQGKVKRNIRETKAVGWFTPKEINKLNLEPVWQYWFKKLKII